MSTDARLSTGLPGHPKTKKLVRRLGPAAGWSLVCLILWARANRPDGDLEGMTAEDIELAADWAGDNDAFVRELAAVGFLDGVEGDYQLHDWAEHQPWSAGSDLRSLKAKWNAVKRHHGESEADRQVPEYARIRAANADSYAGSKKSDATSNAGSSDAAMRAAGTSNAPSPSPSPSPSPKEEKHPHTPSATADGAKPGRKKREKITFAAFLDQCQDAGESAIPKTDPIFAFARDAGIPKDFLHLAWREFAGRHRDSGRLQKDWRAHFRDAVRRNWFKLWWLPPAGGCELTTAGVQLARERDAEKAREQEQAP
ncbi:hypothetical protein ACQ5SB_20675 [Stenotrophomonas geniculata]|uniref:hypothetical protein n=1 Tax=Stenotrophomonas TaxID=40323 RepID=UPI003D34F247